MVCSVQHADRPVAMNAAEKKKLNSLPRREAAFIEPMECALVPKRAGWLAMGLRDQA